MRTSSLHVVTAIHSFGTAEYLSQTVVDSLLEECDLTPKPGLVDARGAGSHQDMDLELLRRSAKTLRLTFIEIARRAIGEEPSLSLREDLGEIGRRGERRMMAATGGTNTHRGAIWTLGLLTASAASLSQEHWLTHSICDRASEIARLPDRHVPNDVNNGTLACRLYGVTGARGEAQEGFPHVQLGLVRLNHGRKSGENERVARIHALLAIMAHLGDTCILHRGGFQGLERTKQGAQQVLNDGGISNPIGMQSLARLDRMLRLMNLSPGGSADLLAAVLMLDRLATVNGRG
ncbi:MAG: triphosphoribosyl-dephospho-CoA synthase MdcB [Acidobacteriaceae bacterium]|jgi:triphosphoribosyl-dephospho-CoA synthase|nr:triphosphoribosyl-dephospho-CoA synthase MdcB [Acidobacteriaceae bacterium]